jgi:DNA adenine methylase
MGDYWMNTQLTLLPAESQKLPPFLKWLGCKTEVAPRLAEIYAPFCDTYTWVEPFCGALGAALGVMPKYALLNDVNPHLINLYRQVKGGFNGFGVDSNLQYATSESSYYRLRERFNYLRSMAPSEQVQVEQAELFYYLNRVGWRGTCRTNSSGGFNVSYGHYKKPKLDHDFALYQKAFGLWQFSSFTYLDFIESFLEELVPYLFVYADPPYDDGFVNYSGAFTWEDQVKLAETLAALNCPVVASNKATDRIQDLYKALGFDIEIISVKRKISCKDDRSPVDEILATKNVKG